MKLASVSWLPIYWFYGLPGSTAHLLSLCVLQVGQRHGGFTGIIQGACSLAQRHIWFERKVAADRKMVAKRSVTIQSPAAVPSCLLTPLYCILWAYVHVHLYTAYSCVYFEMQRVPLLEQLKMHICAHSLCI